MPVENIITSSGNYDPTILTKFISGRGFITNQGPDGLDDDRILFSGGSSCVSPVVGPLGGSITDLFASVELPDGARIKQVVFFGSDTSASDITITLFRNETNIPLLFGSPTSSETAVTSFTTTGTPGVVALASVDNLNEITGNFSPFFLSFNHRFHLIDVTMQNATTTQQSLCGVEVRYQVPVVGPDAGTVFHPITPVRAYDSRITAYPVNGPIPNNSNRVIDVSAGHDLATGAVTLADAVPAGATAITYNLTSAESTTVGFVAITPGNAAVFATSALNLNGTPLANGGTVAIASDRTIKVFVGGGGSTQVIVDVTGYYTSPANMATRRCLGSSRVV